MNNEVNCSYLSSEICLQLWRLCIVDDWSRYCNAHGIKPSCMKCVWVSHILLSSLYCLAKREETKPVTLGIRKLFFITCQVWSVILFFCLYGFCFILIHLWASTMLILFYRFKKSKILGPLNWLKNQKNGTCSFFEWNNQTMPTVRSSQCFQHKFPLPQYKPIIW